MAGASSAAPTTPRSWSGTAASLAAGGAALRHPPHPAKCHAASALWLRGPRAGFIILPQLPGHLRTWMAPRLEGDFASVLQPGLTVDLSAAKGVAGMRDDWRFFFIATGRLLRDAEMSPRLRNLLLTSTALLVARRRRRARRSRPAARWSAAPRPSAAQAPLRSSSTSRATARSSTGTPSTSAPADRRRFNQPNSSAITLNRVTGGMGPSTIDGTLTANGRVFIINRDGMLFGRNAVINTAGFLATTHDIRNADFMAGRMNFNIPGRPDASIVNLGSITASSHGFAALVAPGVRNSGTITATARHRRARLRQQLHPRHVWRQADPARGRRRDRRPR